MLKRRSLISVLVLGYLFSAWALILPQERALIRSTDAEQRREWHKSHRLMQEESPFKHLQWDYIGQDNISGRVTAAAVPEASRQIIYVASASRSVWKTVNAGTTWEPFLEDTISASVGAVALAPSDPSIVWVGLGEANMLRSSQAGGGVYQVVHPRDRILVAATHGRGMFALDIGTIAQ